MTPGLTPGKAYLPVGEGPPDLSKVDWSAAPNPFKHYSAAKKLALPAPGATAQLSQLGVFFAEVAGLTRQRFKHPEAGTLERDLTTPVSFSNSLDLLRSVPSGGALHPYELYLLVSQDSQLAGGLYHYNVLEHALECLIEADVSVALARITRTSDISTRTLVLGCCFSRNAFKYQDFSYRVQSIDLGVVIGQSEAAAARLGWAVNVRYQFDDDRLDRLLGLDSFTEASYVMIEFGDRHEIGGTPDTPNPPEPPSPPQADGAKPPPFSQWSNWEDLHRSARTPFRNQGRLEGVLELPTAQHPIVLPIPQGMTVPLEAVWRRQSAMHAFAHQPLSFEQFARLCSAADGYLNDTLSKSHSALYAIVNAVEGLEMGIYRYFSGSRNLEKLRQDDARIELLNTFGGPSQNAFEVSVGFFAVGNYERGFAAGGDRWYRIQNMDAGVIVARLYRNASALGLACHANLNYKVRVADRMLGLEPPWTSLIQMLVGGLAPNGRKLDMSLIATDLTNTKGASACL